MTNTVHPSLSPEEARQIYREGKARCLNSIERMAYAGGCDDARIYTHETYNEIDSCTRILEWEDYVFQTVDGTMVVECAVGDYYFQSVGFGIWKKLS